MVRRHAANLGYKFLPPDDIIVEMWKRHDYNQTATAEEIGCTPSAVSQRIRRLGLTKPSKAPRYRVLASRTDLEAVEDRLIDLEHHIQVLEKRIRTLENKPNPAPIAPKQPQISHRRIADGGEPVKKQRKRRRQAQTTPTIVRIA